MRQKIIDNYILDFYCPSKKIGIEIENKCKEPPVAKATAPLLKGLSCMPSKFFSE